MNEISYVLSTWAILVAMVSLLVSFQLWRKTNRPVVSAAVVTHSGGNIAILYNLIVYNSGNRPATNTRLRADFEILNQCFDQNAATLNIERIKD